VLGDSFVVDPPAMHIRHLAPALLAVSFVTACGTNDEPYKATPAWSGRKPNLPAPPAPETKPLKAGDAYTVYGASHLLRSRIHEKDVNGKEITIEGYIVQSNIEDAPACAIHAVGKADSDGCKSEVPSFYIADQKTDDPNQPRIRVLGWAKNFATVYDAMKLYAKSKDKPKEAIQDDMLTVEVPYPLPAVGAKIKVTGTYGYTFTKMTTGMVTDPKNGVMTYKTILVTEPAAAPAMFKNGKI
jgi:hypothetical protein